MQTEIDTELKEDAAGVSPEGVALLAVAIWRITRKAETEGAFEKVSAACDRANNCLERLGFECVTPMENQPYDPNSMAVVLQHDSGEGPNVIAQCVSPAVYYRRQLIRRAEIITKGSF